MSEADRDRWDGKYAAKDVPELLQPDDWLTRHAPSLIPGRALDLACGLGHNAIWLAQQGWTVDAVDVSAAGLKLARELATREHSRPVDWIAADLDEWTPAANQYDLVVVFRFLDRDRLSRMIEDALRPTGMLIYETFLRAQCHRADNHLKNPAFTLQPGELPRLFTGLETVDYQEAELPDRTVARWVGRKL